MKIEVAIDKNESSKEKGDLLENLSKKLLEAQGYEVEQELRKTGVEIDLLCTHKASSARKILVECKAHKTKIESEVISKLYGNRGLHKCSEAWLITTSNLSKDAKGLVDNIKNGEESNLFVFYTPKKFIEALISSAIIEDQDISRKAVQRLIKNKVHIGETHLLITKYGYFWITEYIASGLPADVIITYAGNSDFVTDKILLKKLANIESSFKNLNFEKIFDFTEEQKVKHITIKDLKLNSEYLSKINDIGVRITHPQKDNLNLSDMFVYPDLEKVEEKDTGKIDSDNGKVNAELLSYSDCEFKKCLILGDDLAGKTSLARTLQKDLNENEIVSLYLKAEEIKHSDFDKFSNLLIKNFEKQYNKEDHYIEYFKSILLKDKSKIVLFIDDLELLGIRREKSKLDFFKMLEDKFENIFVFINSSMEIEILAKNEMNEIFRNFKILKIKQLGHVLQDRLIEKWLTIENEENITDGELLNRKSEMTEKVKIACGDNFIPTYPLYIITILQLVEAGSSLKLQGSSYAELYQYLIDKALGGANAKPEDLDFYNTYLSYIAHFFFTKHAKEQSEDDMMEMYSEYSEKMEISNDFNSVHNLLTRAKILKNENGEYFFNHNYSYYFFVAKYLSDNMTENREIRGEIDKIIERLYQSEYANIIIFLIHHSKNKDIIDKIVKKSKEVFNEIAPYTLSDAETEEVNSLIQEEINILIDDRSPVEHRREALKMQDEIEDEKNKDLDRPAIYTEEIKELDIFGKINLSFKLMEILGQIAKNYYGSLDGIKKGEILDEAYSVGLRSLRTFLENFKKYTETIKSLTEELLDRKGNLTEEEKKNAEDKIIYSFMEMIIFLYIKRISNSVASKNLFLSIDKVEERNNNSANRIVNTSVKLNFPNGMNIKKICALDQDLGKNYLKKRILRLLVVEHLYKFDVDHSEKQKICDKLGIEINNKALIAKKMANN